MTSLPRRTPPIFVDKPQRPRARLSVSSALRAFGLPCSAHMEEQEGMYGADGDPARGRSAARALLGRVPDRRLGGGDRTGSQGSPGASTVDQAGGSGIDQRGHLFDSALDGGFAAAYWVEGLTNHATDLGRDRYGEQGRHPALRDAAHAGHRRPPTCRAQARCCTLDSATRTGRHSVQRFTATETGTYVLAMTNDDIYLTGPIQCLSALDRGPFTFTVTQSLNGKGSGGGDAPASQSSGGSKDAGGPARRMSCGRVSHSG